MQHPGIVAFLPAAQRGAEILLMPRHVCPTVNLAEKVVLIDDGIMQDVVAVTARAHDLLADERVPVT